MTAESLCSPDDIEMTGGPKQLMTISHPQLCKGAILVMDDDGVIQTLFSTMLECLGYTTVCACEGDEALKLYKQAQNDGSPFTGVILDLHNRLGKGGLETLDSLRELDPEVHAVICSADSDAQAMRQYQTYGFKSALGKPFGLQELQNILLIDR